MGHFYGLTKMKIDNIQTATKEIDPKALQYSLYPNPSHGQITITNPQLNKRQIDIYSMSGALVSSHTSADAEWSTTLGAGVYWVRLRQGKNEVVEKIVVVGN